MQVYMVSDRGYYVKSVQTNGAVFTNQPKMAHSFSDMTMEEFERLKEKVETSLKCELVVEFH
ncbi:hypothetical protein PP175_27775 (plasmid) [Aneurinibacillus sp. Ricciae_BoGa-3]|uniref:hypothetical protein n=1 Tax=Aneurinibacillus sp. Ricciae_BoGa-3 TaxID=3022697 RepID=UPI0023402325|nr:hypothetical protein [Aneurinibacillus sp. Ricciae_BoGa-3]WCK56993.1 hypothetical protein PP175_27775 [Aneurinibacillus sp. Ricciae_BoGa-3]